MSFAGMPSGLPMTLAIARPVKQAVYRWFDRTIATALDVLLPPACALCGDFVSGVSIPEPASPISPAVSVMFCANCAAALRNWPSKLSPCPRCALPRPLSDTTEQCVRCKSWTFHFDRALTAGAYQGAMAEAVVAAKSPRNAALAANWGDGLLFKLGRWTPSSRRIWSPGCQPI